MPHPMQLVRPSLDRLPSYVAALKRGWSPDNITGAAASIGELEQIEKDPRSFVDSLTDREAKGPPITLPDGTTAPLHPDRPGFLESARRGTTRRRHLACSENDPQCSPARPRPLGLAQAASAAIDTGKVANGDGSSSSLTCLQDVNCK